MSIISYFLSFFVLKLIIDGFFGLQDETYDETSGHDGRVYLFNLNSIYLFIYILNVYITINIQQATAIATNNRYQPKKAMTE